MKKHYAWGSMLALTATLLWSCEKENVSTIAVENEARAGSNFKLGAERIIDFESFSAGTIVSDVYSISGVGSVKVNGFNDIRAWDNAAMIFDSSNPTGGDPDLGSPNQDFGGPGIGLGGKAGAPYQNNITLGKVLIVTEDFDSSDPDDAGAPLGGMKLEFDFTALGPVNIYRMHIIDVEGAVGEGVQVKFFDANGTQIGADVSLPSTGDNGVALINFNEALGVANVAKMLVLLNRSSGAIDNIVFAMDEPEVGGCTFTYGYWKNHSLEGSASHKRDVTWDKIGENTIFFKSGQSYYNVMITPVQGNVYYSLAHQYIAALLNTKKGTAAPTEVQNAIISATTLFNTYTPAQIAPLKGSDALRKQFVALSEVLDAYNNGVSGPEHCDDRVVVE